MARVICFDIETTGFEYLRGDRCIEIGAVEMVDGRITELEQLILHAVVVDETEIDHSKISVGSTVKVKKGAKEMEYSIVSTNEVDFWSGKISDQSPIGAALIGAREGDTVTVESPNGDFKLKIVSVTRAK